MTQKVIDRLLELADRLVTIAEKRWIPTEEPHGEIWKQGEARQEVRTPAEYRNFEPDGPGRFAKLVNAKK